MPPLQPDERTSMEIFAKKTVYCERNTVVTVVKADREEKKLQLFKDLNIQGVSSGQTLISLCMILLGGCKSGAICRAPE